MEFLPVRPAAEAQADQFYMRGWFTHLWRYIRGQNAVGAAQTATFSTDNEYVFYPVDTTAGAVVVNLPPVNGNLGKMFIIKRTAGANNVTLTPAGSDTIDGAGTLAIGTTGHSAWIVSDGNTTWYQIRTP